MGIGILLLLFFALLGGMLFPLELSVNFRTGVIIFAYIIGLGYLNTYTRIIGVESSFAKYVFLLVGATLGIAFDFIVKAR